MRRFIAKLAICCGVAFAGPPAWAEIDGHGPDAWAVTGVAADDVLNMRMGPGTQYMVIDHLAPDARGLEQITCVPLLIPSIYHRLTDEQRANLPQRWCLMRTGDFSKAGWVAQRFLMEDGLEEITGPAGGSDSVGVVQTIGDALIDGAAHLVGDLYTAFEAQRSTADNPFAPDNASRYFFSDLVPSLRGHGADVLYNGQDFQGEVTQIAPDPNQPMLRGMITVNVDFTNFGLAQRAVFNLRADISQPDAPMRIFRVQHGEWSFPQ
ncbi:hypothetical protein [uncultured Aliiroseovarius sp.]|uniref:SH3 domain-containing protein n=1 Tax=uncultured Aliiroseovarius sp. TaxID=1658783 RepID=UPI002591C1AF|nr:hypothetical protein [uncultured Aliiroseovarius sp.]